ncbi:MAG: LamG-like jellyroll fold domain-containing protein [Balneola sp.]
MNKFFLTLSALLSFLLFRINPVFAQDSLATDTLVAYYPFSGSAADSSGFGNDGEVFGATLTKDRFGNENSAYEFDGIDDLINFGNDSSLNITGELTLSVWAKGAGPKEAVTALIGKTSFSIESGGGMAPYGIALDEGSRLFTFIRNSEQVTGLLKDDLITNINEWIHYASVFRPGEYLKLYKNGELIDSLVSEVPDSIGVEASRQLVAGARTNSSNPNLVYYFDGALDDIRVYSKALSDSAVQELYLEKGWPETKYVIPDTLVAYYPFSGSAADSSGFGNDGEVFGAKLTKDRFGNENSAYEFDGIDDYIRIPDADHLTPTGNEWSVSVWFKVTYPGDRFILYKGSSTNNREYASGVRVDSLGSFQINENGSATNRDGVVTTSSLKENVWNHLVGVWDSSSIKIYLNNKLEAIDSTDLKISNFDSDLFIGTYGGAISQYAFNGAIDDLRIYNYAISDSAVQELYMEKGWPETKYVIPDTLVAYYPFSGSAADSSGFGNDGEVFGAKLTKDRFGNENSAYGFDGINDFINLGNDESLNLETGFTFSVWAKGSSSENSIAGLISKANGGYPYIFGIDDGDRVLIRASSEEGVNFPEVIYTQSKDVIYDWHHYAGVYKPSEYLKIFKDGVQVAVLEDSVLSKTYVNNEDTWIGARRNHTDIWRKYHFKGALDDIRIFNYAVSDSVISDFYLEKGWPETKYFIPDTLVAYYPFNGNTADSSGFGNDGEVFGATLVRDRFGNENSAYEFDGQWDYISLPHTEEFNVPYKTINFWFKRSGSKIDMNSRGTHGEGLAFKAFDTSINREFGIELFGAEAPFDLSFSVGSITEQKNIGARIDSAIYANTWYQVTAVIDTSSIALYLDGTMVDSTEYSVSLFTNSAPVVLGKASSQSMQERYLEGMMDDIRIYNYVLSDSAIQALYSENGWPETEYVIPDTLVAYYPFSGSAADSSGFGNDGEVFGAKLTKDRFGNENSAYEFDGIDDYIRIPDADHLTPTGNEWSVSVWFKVTYPGDRFILYKGSSTNNREYASGVRVDSLGSFQINENGSATNRDGVVTTSSLKENVWNHLVGVWDSSSIKIYLNNKLEAIDSTDLKISNFDSDLFIGTYGGAISQYAFNGAIDDLRIYNSSLDSSYIASIYKLKGWPETMDTTLTSNEIRPDIPEEFKLYQNYPNPFNPSTVINYDLPEASAVSIRIFDLTGRLVATIVDESKTAGRYQVTFNAAALSSGVYFYELKTNTYSSVKKFTLIK